MATDLEKADSRAGSMCRSVHNRHPRISQQRLRRALDAAEADFLRCWRTLAKMKAVDLGPEGGQAILAFQPTLASALVELEKLFRELQGYRQELLQRKARLSAVWFTGRMRTLAVYTEAVEDALGIGKNIGDAFAWFFYRNDQDLILRHLRHSQIKHMPVGIGARGEIEFIRQVRYPGYLFLFHGITSFLRIGDVSIVNLSQQHVIALGELKSVETAPRQLDITLHMVCEKGEAVPFAPRLANLRNTTPTVQPTKMTAEMKRRLQKQLTNMGAIVKKETEGHSQSELRNAYHIQELERLANEVRTRRTAYQQVGEGLLIAAVRPYSAKSLAGRMFSRLKGEDIVNRLTDLVKNVMPLIRPSSPDNRLLIGTFETKFVPGFLPTFWWPLLESVLRMLYFGECVITTAYNPAHLLQSLRNEGFEVEITSAKGRERFSVSKATGKGTLTVPDLDYFIELVRHHLMKEEKLLQMLRELVAKASTGEIPENALVGLNIVQVI